VSIADTISRSYRDRTGIEAKIFASRPAAAGTQLFEV
jgi:hypothetical protein